MEALRKQWSLTLGPNLVIVVVLVMQLKVFFNDDWVFPFINYPMYSHSSSPGPLSAIHSTVILHLESGDKLHFLPQAGQELSRSVSVYGLSQTVYQREYLFPMINERDPLKRESLARSLGNRLNRSALDRVVMIEVQSETYWLNKGRIGKTGDSIDFFTIGE